MYQAIHTLCVLYKHVMRISTILGIGVLSVGAIIVGGPLVGAGAAAVRMGWVVLPLAFGLGSAARSLGIRDKEEETNK